MANHNLPLITSTYSNFVSELDSRLDDITTWIPSSTVTATYLPQGAIRWNDTSYTWEKNTAASGTQSPTWAAFSTRYDININGTVGATTPNTGSFTTLTTSSTTTLAANTTVGGLTPVTTTGTQTLTNKTLTTPIISSISNTGTITLPTSTTTLVGTNTTDTLTNKTLTSPKFANGGTITDTGSRTILQFTATGSAVNYLILANADTGTSPSLTTTGTDTNINLNLVSKGSGVVQLNGIAAVDISTAQTLTNKTLSTSSVWNGSVINSTYGGTGVNNSGRTLTISSNATISGTNTGDQTITLTGDVTGSGTGSFTATLAASGVTAGTYTKLTVDSKGRATAGTSLTSGDVTTALGYTPVNKAGDTITAQINLNYSNPTICFQDSDHNVSFLHCNENKFYLLRGATNATIYTQVGSYWPAYWDLTNNNATFGGSLWCAGNVTAYSDERIKVNWQDLDSDFITKLAGIKAGTFDRTDINEQQVGVSAQALQTILPQAVQHNKEHDLLSVSYGNAALTAAVYLARRVLELEQKLDKLQHNS